MTSQKHTQKEKRYNRKLFKNPSFPSPAASIKNKERLVGVVNLGELHK